MNVSSDGRRSSAGIPLLALLAVLCLVPPEARGVSLAACAVLMLLAWIGSTSGTTFSRGPRLALLAGTILVFPFVLWSSTPASSVTPITLFVTAGAIGSAALHARSDPTWVARITRLFAGIASVIALYGVYQRLFSLERLATAIASDATLPDAHDLAERAATGRAFGTFSTPAALGIFLAIALPLTIALAVSRPGRGRIAWGVAAVVQLSGLLATASATATLSLLGALGLAAIAWPATRRVAAIGAGTLALILVGVVLIRGGEVLSPTNEDSPVRLRAGNFRSATAMAADHPWLGVGPGGFAENYSRYRRAGDNETNHAHSLPLEMVAETGLVAGIGFSVLFLWVFLDPIRRMRASDAAWRRGLAIGLAAFAIHNLADYTAYMPSLLWTAALLRGLLPPPEEPTARPESNGRGVLWASTIPVMLAAGLQLLSGLSADARIESRFEAFAGHADQAERLAERAVRLAPWDPDAALTFARATARGDAIVDASDDRRRLALARAERAVRLAPTRAACRGERSRARLVTGDVAGAYADLTEAVRLYPLHDGYREDRTILGERISSGLASMEGP